MPKFMLSKNIFRKFKIYIDISFLLCYNVFVTNNVIINRKERKNGNDIEI